MKQNNYTKDLTRVPLIQNDTTLRPSNMGGVGDGPVKV